MKDIIGVAQQTVLESAVKLLINGGYVTISEGLAILNSIETIHNMYNSNIPITPEECTVENGTIFPEAVKSLLQPRRDLIMK